MNKLVIALAIVVVLAGGAYLFREPLMAEVFDLVTADMFVAVDTDAYDPGIAIGEPFPSIRARYRGEEITTVTPFMGENGMILVANRSVDW